MKAAIIERAQQLIERGYTPLPLNGKAPTLTGWQDATVTADSLAEWQESGKLHNLGLRTGDKGLVVLDFDGLSGYTAFCAGFSELIDTHTVKTGSGAGMHVYLTLQGELPRSTGQMNMPGGGHIEIKAKGRQVVIPPSIHPETQLPYEVYVTAPIKVITTFAPIQEWIDAFNPKPEYTPTPTPHQGAAPTAQGEFEAYARAALNNMALDLSRMSNVELDNQNDTLNEMAWKLAHFVRRGDLSESECRNALLGAMSSNGYSSNPKWGGRRQAEKTFDSGFNRGYSDTSFEPEIYTRPTRNQWKGQRKPDRQMPGDWQAYEPSMTVKSEKGLTVIRRTKIVKRQSLFSDLLERIQDDKYIPANAPIRFPLKTLQQFGGQAYVSQPGKVVGFVGTSGSGKTSALETVADLYAENGTPVAIWTPEWTPEEMAERTLQRHEGVTQDQLYDQDIDNYNVNVLGLPSDEKLRIPENQWANTAQIFRKLRTWKEDVYFIHNDLLTVDELAEVIADAKSICNPFPRVLICDYAQLLKANDVENPEESNMYNLIQRFKSICIHFGLVGWIATQATKDESRRAPKEGEFKGSTVLNVTKNSRGKTGKVRLPSEPSRLRILDQMHPSQIFDTDEYYLGSQSGRYVNDDAYNLFITLNPEYFKG